MKILVIGSGGREHALIWKLAQSSQTETLWCAPGNAGIGQEPIRQTGQRVELIAIGSDDLPSLLAFAKEKKPDLTVVGPDNPLGLGIVDLFQQNHLRIWGPNQKAAQFEASKVFAQNFMAKYGIPTAPAGTFSQVESALEFARQLGGRCAVKADGLALGKGVRICQNLNEATSAIEDIMVRRIYGPAGSQLVIQEYLTGMEVSLHVLCDGRHTRLFPSSQDHKRAFDHDSGPNTGGMGAYCPAPFLTEADLSEIDDHIIQPWQQGCLSEGIHYQGILYPGIMLTQEGPKVLEFNARFGDPETQVYLPRLDTDLIDLIEASMNGSIDRCPLNWNSHYVVCVVMAAKGYPGSYTKGYRISGLSEVSQLPKVKVFHAGTAVVNNEIVTAGGRVLGVTGWASTLVDARAKAYQAAEMIQFEGAHYRQDIAAKALHDY